MKEQGVYQQLRSHLAYLRLTAASEQLAPALDQAADTQQPRGTTDSQRRR